MFQSLTQTPRTQTPVSGLADQPAFTDSAGKHKCLGHKASDILWVSTSGCSEPYFISTCFSPLAVEIVRGGHHRCTYQMSPLLVTGCSGVLMTGEGVGSFVDMTGHHPSERYDTLRRKVRTAPRESPTQHPAHHPTMCSRDEGDSGGHSFQQPSSHAAGTPTSINRLAWGHQQHIMTPPATFQVDYGA